LRPNSIAGSRKRARRLRIIASTVIFWSMIFWTGRCAVGGHCAGPSASIAMAKQSPTVREECWRCRRLSANERAGSAKIGAGGLWDSRLKWRPAAARIWGRSMTMTQPKMTAMTKERTTIPMTIETQFDSNYRKVLVAARRARQLQKRLARACPQPVQQGMPHRAG